MQILINIDDEQIEKSLAESKFIHEEDGEKGCVHIMMLYTNGKLEFVDVSRKTEFYSCEYEVLPKGHGRLIDADKLKAKFQEHHDFYIDAYGGFSSMPINEKSRVDEISGSIASVVNAPTIIEADKEQK